MRIYFTRHICSFTNRQDVYQVTEIERIEQWRIDMGRCDLCVKWVAFEEDTNTWEMADHLAKRIPKVVMEYAVNTGNIALQE